MSAAETSSAQCGGPAPQYKVVETSDVSDVELTRILNEMVADGWVLDGIHFAMRDSSRRPAMAFVLFQRAQARPIA